MKSIPILFFVLLLTGCTAEQAEEFAFRKTMEYQLKEECGKKDKACIQAVEEQIESCMQKSEWKKYVDDSENEAEMQRFIRAFFPCFKDARGKPLFDVD